MNKDEAKYCPQCGAASLDISALANTPVHCRACAWTGAAEALYTVPFFYAQGSREGIANELLNDLRRVLSSERFMVGFVGFLGRWGFVNLQQEKKLLAINVARYAAATARAVLTSVIEEREKVEKEACGNGRPESRG